MKVFTARANIELIRNEWQSVLDYGQVAIDQARRIGDDSGLVGVYFQTTVAWTALGRLDNASRDARLAVDAVKRINIPFKLWLAYGGLLNPAMLAGDRQTVSESETWFEEYMPDYPPLIANKAWAAFEAGDRHVGLKLVDELAEACRTVAPPRSMYMAWHLAKLMRHSGDLTHIDIASQRNVDDIATAGRSVSLKFVWITGSAILALLKKDVPLANKFYKLLLPHSGTADPGFWGGAVPIDRLLGEIAALLGDRQAAIGHFEDALEFSRSGGFRPDLARACDDYASLLLAEPGMSEPSKIAGLIDEGTHIASDLSMIDLIARFDHLRSELISLTRSNAFRPAGLTRRELEVLQLLAKGLSNHELATNLGISEHTVFTHVSRILAKTESNSRAQAITYAHRSGIA